MNIEAKHRALLDEAARQGRKDGQDIALCFQILSLADAIDRDCASRLAPWRLSESRFVLLFLLHGQPEGLSPHELAERAGVTRATITGLLDGMERDGFLRRQGDPQDRRKLRVRLTAKGCETGAALFDGHMRWIASLLAGLGTDDRRELGRLLGMVWQNTDQATGKDGA